MYYLTEFCFLCLTHDKCLKNILSKHNDIQIVQRILKFLLPEYVFLKSEIPKYICNDCLKYLDDIHKYRQRCLENASIMEEYVKTLTEFDGLFKNLKVSLTNLEENFVEKNVEESEVKIEVIEHEELILKDEILEEFITEKDPILNNFIDSNEIQNNIEDFNVPVHFMSENDHTSVENIIQPSNEQPTLNNKSMENIQKKMKKSNEKVKKKTKTTPHKCLVCFKTLSSKRSLLRHMLIHIRKNNIHCPTCKKKFSSISDLESHKKIHCIEYLQCPECNKKFKEKDNLMSHLATHFLNRPLKCHLCQFTTSRINNLERHVRNHDIKKYVCKICYNRFTSAYYLNQHDILHSNVRPFNCNLCGLTFKMKSGVTKHMRMHSRNSLLVPVKESNI